jgi:opacity protein-like surface antigen
MKKVMFIVAWLAPGLSFIDVQAQEMNKRDHVVVGLSYGAAQGEVILNNNAVGLELGGFRQKSPNYAFGVSADFIFSSGKSHPVHIPNNLMTNESLEPAFLVFALTTVHRVDLNPESSVKFFMEGKAGFRLANYSVTHTGYLLFVKSEDRIYNDTSFGLCAGLSTGIYIPLTSDLRYGLRLKTSSE